MSTAKELKKEIERGVWDASLGKLYGRRAGVLERQRARYADALDCFAALYGGEREAAIYSAPGRTEIGGNHTDHNHGVVMAGAVDLDVIAVVSKNTDDVVRVKSKGFDGRDEVKLEQLSPVPAEQGRSAALIRGVAAGIAKQGGVLGGFDAYTTSDVLRGSGLSSSAAFEVVIGTVFNGEYNNTKLAIQFYLMNRNDFLLSFIII
jgi:galactokinase